MDLSPRGELALDAFTRAHADLVMSKLPTTMKRGTRRQVAQLVSRVLRLAVFVGEIRFSPLPPGWLPKAPKADTIAKENKLRLRLHDARAFFITAGIFAGRDVLWITDRSGHTTLALLRRYERDVRRWRELGEQVAAADEAIPELQPRFRLQMRLQRLAAELAGSS